MAPVTSGWARLLTQPALQLFGRISYGLYVFHHLLIFFLRDRGVQVNAFPRMLGSQLPGQALLLLLATTLSLALALLSWQLLEEPLLRLKHLFT